MPLFSRSLMLVLVVTTASHARATTPIAPENQRLSLELQIATRDAVQANQPAEQLQLFQRIEAGTAQLSADQRVAILETLLTTLDGAKEMAHADFFGACVVTATVAALSGMVGHQAFKGRIAADRKVLMGLMATVAVIAAIAHGAEKNRQVALLEVRLKEVRSKIQGLISANRREAFIDGLTARTPQR